MMTTSNLKYNSVRFDDHEVKIKPNRAMMKAFQDKIDRKTSMLGKESFIPVEPHMNIAKAMEKTKDDTNVLTVLAESENSGDPSIFQQYGINCKEGPMEFIGPMEVVCLKNTTLMRIDMTDFKRGPQA